VQEESTAMLVHALAVALPLVLAGGEKASTGSSAEPNEKTNEKTSDRVRDDSLPGASGAEGQGGLDAKEGKGRQDDLAAGEAGDTTSGAPSGRWDRSGGRSARETPDPDGMRGEGGTSGGSDARGHANDKIVSGRLSAISGDEITIRSRAGEQKLKIVPQTALTLDGRDAQRSELKEGLPVRASFLEHGGAQIAVRIEAGRRADAEASRPPAQGKGGSPGAEAPQPGGATR
jgi:hypothetical protein